MAKFGFNSAEVDVNATVSRDPIPAGEYTLKALEADEKQTSTGGMMIKAKFEVVKGDYAGRWIWQNFNIVNKSEKAQNIGRQQLVGWATACGKPEADDTDKLLDKPFNAIVEIEKGTGGYSDSNKIKSFLFASDDTPKTAKPAAKPAPAAKGAANPWD
jgi:hypothetical protein